MQDVPLIPLKVLLGNPLHSSAKVSPDGRYISYLRPSPDKDVLNVWVRSRQAAGGGAGADDVMVTHDTHRGVRLYEWAEDSRHIIFLQDVGGDEDWHLYVQAVDSSSPSKDLTPFKGVRVENIITDPNHPTEVLVGLNKRDPRCFDMYRLNISSGQLQLDTENPGDVVAWYADANFQVRAALAMNPSDGSKTLRVRQGPDAAWADLITWPQEEEGRVVCFAKDGRSVYVTSSLGRDTTELQLLATDPAAAPAAAAAEASQDIPARGAVAAIQRQTSGVAAAAAAAEGAGSGPASSSSGPAVLSRLASSGKCDVGQVLIDRLQRLPLAVGFNYSRQEWQVLESSLQADFKLLLSFKGADADLSVEARSLDGSVWLVAYSRDDAATEYYVYDRSAAAAGAGAAGALQFLFVNRPELSSYKLGRRHPVLLQARDGVTLPSYLTLPPVPRAPNTLLPENPEPSSPGAQGWGSVSGLQLPLVLFVHGGPWARDGWGLDSTAQWFANRGYAVLQVNYRASSGFGKRFLHLGDGQWGVGTMQHDLSDAVAWAVGAGIADKARVAIYGGSYGGYACLAGLAFTPELYCCGVDIVGPSHVLTLLGTIPAYWAPMKRMLVDRIGDAEGDDALNRRISPLYHADTMRAPLIIAQGANDPRVKRAESDQIYNALKGKGLEVQYFLYEDEGHGFARPPNRLDFCSRVDQFLAKHLGGRTEPPLQMQDTSVVALHEFKSLDDYKPPAAAAAGAGDSSAGKGRAAAVAAAAAVAGAAVAGAKHGGSSSSGSAMGLGQKVGLAVGIPAAVLAGAAVVVVAVLRGLSPRR